MFRHLLFVMAIAPQAVPVAAADQPAGQNLVVDSSLEGHLGNDGLPPDWARNSPEPSTVQAYAQLGGKSGERMLRFQSTADWATVATPRMTLQPKAKQSGQVWFRPAGKSEGQLTVYISYFTATGTLAGNSSPGTGSLTEPVKTTDWQRLEAECAGDQFPEASTFQLTIGMLKPGIVVLDDFFLRQSLDKSMRSLVPFGEMELPEKELLASFPVYTSEGGIARLRREVDRPHVGESCLRFSGSAVWAVTQIAEIAIPAGKTVRGSAWVRVRNGNCSFKLAASNPAGIVFEDFLYRPPTPSWQELSWKFIPEKLGSADKLTIQFAVEKDFDVFLDDVFVTLE